MKLVQLNVWGGAMNYYLLDFLAAQNADILMLQEVNSSPDGKTFWFDFLQDLMEKTPFMPHIFYSPRYDTLYGKKRMYHGNAILAQHALENRHTEFVNLEYKSDFDHAVDSPAIHNFQHATIAPPNGKRVHLINYHGYAQPLGVKTGNDMTTEHCRRIHDYAAALKGPVILTGDYNLQPDSVSLAAHNATWRNLCIENNIKTTRNQYAFPKETVDYIWVSKDIRVNEFHVMPEIVSDHAALVLDFDII